MRDFRDAKAMAQTLRAALERGICSHIPIEVGGAGECRRQDSYRRPGRESPHGAGDVDPNADVGAAGMPISALPEMIGCKVSPAPAVPNVSSTRPCFLKIPTSWPSVGAWFSQLLIWPIATFRGSCFRLSWAWTGDTANAGAKRASARLAKQARFKSCPRNQIKPGRSGTCARSAGLFMSYANAVVRSRAIFNKVGRVRNTQANPSFIAFFRTDEGKTLSHSRSR
jgi:hypothetical protein